MITYTDIFIRKYMRNVPLLLVHNSVFYIEVDNAYKIDKRAREYGDANTRGEK